MAQLPDSDAMLTPRLLPKANRQGLSVSLVIVGMITDVLSFVGRPFCPSSIVQIACDIRAPLTAVVFYLTPYPGRLDSALTIYFSSVGFLKQRLAVSLVPSLAVYWICSAAIPPGKEFSRQTVQRHLSPGQRICPNSGLWLFRWFLEKPRTGVRFSLTL